MYVAILHSVFLQKPLLKVGLGLGLSVTLNIPMHLEEHVWDYILLLMQANFSNSYLLCRCKRKLLHCLLCSLIACITHFSCRVATQGRVAIIFAQHIQFETKENLLKKNKNKKYFAELTSPGVSLYVCLCTYILYSSINPPKWESYFLCICKNLLECQ